MKKVLSFVLALVLVITTMPLGAIGTTVGAIGEDVDIPIDDEYPILTLDAPQTVEINEETINVFLKFVPEEDGTYAFYSNTDVDTCGYIYDSQFNQLLFDDDDGEELNFKLIYQMNAGETYYICPDFLSEDTYGSFEVFAKKIKTLSNLEITSLPYNLEYYKGYVINVDNYGLKLKATWSDGTITEHEIGNEENFIGEYYISVFESENVNEDGIIYIHCANFELSFKLTLVENPVESIEVMPSEINWIENTIGTYDEYYDEETGELKEYFWYEYGNHAILDKINVKINYNDDTSKIVSATETVDGYSFNYDSNQSPFTPWTVDSENYCTISYLGKEARVAVKIVPSPVESIEVMPSEINWIENTIGTYDEYYDEEIGELKEYFRYEYGSYAILDKINVKINYSDGTSKTVIASETVDGNSFNYDSNQSHFTPWTVDSDNYFSISYLGKEARVAVKIVPSPVESIEVVSGEISCVENASGHYELGYNEETGEEKEYFHYDYSMPDDLKIKINYVGGDSKIASINEEIDGYTFNHYSSQSLATPWTIGGDNYITIEYLDKKTRLPVTIVENLVDHIELVKGTSKTYIENQNGYYESDPATGEFFYYNIQNHDDAEIEIFYKNSPSVTAHIYDFIDDYQVEWYDCQYNNHWVVGTNNRSVISYLGHTVVLPITVIEAVPATGLNISVGDLLKGYSGDFYYLDAKFTPDNAIVEDVIWTSSDSNVVLIDEFPEGKVAKFLNPGTATITATSKNGLTATCAVTVNDYLEITLNEPQTAVISIDDRWLHSIFKFIPEEDGYYAFYSNTNYDTFGYILDSQFNELTYNDDAGESTNFKVKYEMKAGETFYIKVKFLSDEIFGSFEVFAEKSKGLTNLEIVSLPDNLECYKGTVEEFDYTGLKLKAFWSDGSETVWEYGENYYIDDYYYVDIYPSEYVDQDSIIYIQCADFELSFEITVLESPVTSIEITKQPNKVSKGYMPNFIGTEVTITYTGGTTKVVTFTEDNIIYNGYSSVDGGWCQINVDGYPMKIDVNYSELGMRYYVKYIGADCEFDDYLLEDNREIASIELDNVLPNGDGMKIELTYTDGITEILTTKNIFEDSWMLDDYCVEYHAYGLTKNGILSYSIISNYDEDNCLLNYEVYIFDRTILVDANKVVKGDVNNDAELNLKDLIALSRYVAEWENLTVNESALDVNGDGEVDLDDVNHLARYLAGWDVTLS